MVHLVNCDHTGEIETVVVRTCIPYSYEKSGF